MALLHSKSLPHRSVYSMYWIEVGTHGVPTTLYIYGGRTHNHAIFNHKSTSIIHVSVRHVYNHNWSTCMDIDILFNHDKTVMVQWFFYVCLLCLKNWKFHYLRIYSHAYKNRFVEFSILKLFNCICWKNLISIIFSGQLYSLDQLCLE